MRIKQRLWLWLAGKLQARVEKRVSVAERLADELVAREDPDLARLLGILPPMPPQGVLIHQTNYARNMSFGERHYGDGLQNTSPPEMLRGSLANMMPKAGAQIPMVGVLPATGCTHGQWVFLKTEMRYYCYTEDRGWVAWIDSNGMAQQLSSRGWVARIDPQQAMAQQLSKAGVPQGGLGFLSAILSPAIRGWPFWDQ